MKNTWQVTVEVDGRKVISISEGSVSGIGDVSDYEDEIRECAKHLLAFIGELGQLNNKQLLLCPHGNALPETCSECGKSSEYPICR